MNIRRTALASAITVVLCMNQSAHAQNNANSTRASEPQSVSILNSTINRLEFMINVPAPELVQVETEQGVFHRLIQGKGAQLHLRHGPGAVSTPQTPVYNAMLAVPIDGAIRSVKIEPVGGAKRVTARLWPVQPPERSKADERQEEGKFVFDKDKYLSSTVSIAKVGKPRPVQQVDANIMKVAVNLMDYEPERELLTYYSKLAVRIEFENKSNCLLREHKPSAKRRIDRIDRYLDKRRNPIVHAVLNADIVNKYRCGVLNPAIYGARFVIVTHPDFLDAAENLRDHKVAMGISTRIVTTQTISNNYGDGSGDVNDVEIFDYLKNFYRKSIIKPSWVMLLGDAEFIPTHYTDQTNFWDSARNAGDQFYGQLDGNELSIPVYGIGRLPVDTNEQAQTIVDKIIAYDMEPAMIFDRFTGSLAFAAEFQDRNPANPVADGIAVRGFAQTAEEIRDQLVSKDYQVDRIYRTDSPGTDPTNWIDGTPIPGELDASVFSWDGDTQDIIDAANQGRSVIMHRDHGWWNSWSTPSLTSWDLPQIQVTDNHFPFVLSINCASGIFDNETVDDSANIVGSGYGPNTGSVYMAERFVRQADGALAVIGDTRSSGTWANNDMARGLFDALSPDFKSFGGANQIRTMGDILNHAKGFVASTGLSDSGLKQENTIYNLLGDPSQEVRMKAPIRFVPPEFTWEELRGLLEVVVGFDPTKPICDPACPIGEKPKLHHVRVVAQHPESGKVIARNLAGKTGRARLNMGRYRGPVKLTISAPGARPVVKELSL